MAANILKINNEVLAVFCNNCKCCLAGTTHCATCHTRKAIKTLCGCGDCVQKAEDYIQREEARTTHLATDRAAKAIANA